MCLKTRCTYTLCGQCPQSWIVYPCVSKGLCQVVAEHPFTLRDYCPECYMVEDPRKDLSTDVSKGTLWEFTLSHFDTYNTTGIIDAIYDRAQAYVDEYIDPADRDNLYIFCSPERLNVDVYQHLMRLVYDQLVPHFWLTVQKGRGNEITRERRILMLQLRQAILPDFTFNLLATKAKAAGNESVWRKAMGMHSRWLTSIVDNPPDDRCGVDLESLANEEAVLSLPCGHMFHEHCLESYDVGDRCPMCRRESRGPLPDISVANYGPIPRWLEAIAPFQRPRIDHELRSLPPPTDKYIARLEKAIKDAQSIAAKYHEELLQNKKMLWALRFGMRSKTMVLAGLVSSISEEDWVELNSRHPEIKPPSTLQSLFAQRNFLLMESRADVLLKEEEHMEHFDLAHDQRHDPQNPHTHRYHKWKEWQAAQTLEVMEKRMHQVTASLERTFLNCLPDNTEYVLDLREDRSGEVGEETLEKLLRLILHLWRVAIITRDKAIEDLDFALYHRSLFEDPK